MNREVEDFLSSHPYADATKKTYRDILSRLLSRSDLKSLSASDLLNLLNSQGWGNSRQCLALAAAQKFIAWMYGQSHPALNARLKRIPPKPQRTLDADEALQLLASFNPYIAKGARDLAITSLALDTGLRESELCRLQLADTDLEHRVLQVIVKGGQWAAAVFSEQTAAHIERWLNYRTIADGQGFLFTNTRTGKGLTPQGLQSIVKDWGRKIGLKISPHVFRRSMATLATELSGAPERVLMEGGRWHNSQMIHRYTRTLKLEAMRRYLPMVRLSSP